MKHSKLDKPSVKGCCTATVLQKALLIFFSLDTKYIQCIYKYILTFQFGPGSSISTVHRYTGKNN